MISSENGKKYLKFPVGSPWSLFLRDVDVNNGAYVEYANDDNRFFKVDLGTINLNAPNTPEWNTISSTQGLEISREDHKFFHLFLEKGRGQYPIITENPATPEKKDEVAVLWSLNKTHTIASVGVETEYPVEVFEERIFPQTRVIRKSVNNPTPNGVFNHDLGLVRLASNVHLHPGLITTGVDINTSIQRSENTNFTVIPWYEAVYTADGIGQAALGLALAEAAKDPIVARVISSALMYQIDHSKHTPKPATLKYDMARVRDAQYTVTIDSQPNSDTWITEVAGSQALSAGFYPRGNVTERKHYFAPGLKIDGSLEATLPVHLDHQSGLVKFVTDKKGQLMDASEIDEDLIPLKARKTISLGRVLTNSQRIVGTMGTNIQLVEANGYELEDLSHLGETDNAPLMAALYRVIATAALNPLNPHSKKVNEALVASLSSLAGL